MSKETSTPAETADSVGPAAPAGATEAPLTIARFPEKLAVVRLGPGSEVPAWAESSSVFSVTATALETSVICATRSVPTKAVHRRPFAGFAVASEIDPGDASLLVSLLSPLAEAGIAVIVSSTHDTHWFLVPLASAEEATEVWRRRGHKVGPATPIRTRPGKSNR